MVTEVHGDISSCPHKHRLLASRQKKTTMSPSFVPAERQNDKPQSTENNPLEVLRIASSLRIASLWGRASHRSPRHDLLHAPDLLVGGHPGGCLAGRGCLAKGST